MLGGIRHQEVSSWVLGPGSFIICSSFFSQVCHVIVLNQIYSNHAAQNKTKFTKPIGELYCRQNLSWAYMNSGATSSQEVHRQWMLRFSVQNCIQHTTNIFCEELEHDNDREGDVGVKGHALAPKQFSQIWRVLYMHLEEKRTHLYEDFEPIVLQ